MIFTPLYSSPISVWELKLRRIRWEGHVARMGEGRGVYRVFVGKWENFRERDDWGDLGINARITLR
jgi:hypothetical protein